MQLKETAFAYNVTTGQSATSDWGAEIGQKNTKVMDAEGAPDLISGMLYYKIDDFDKIEANLGRGNRKLFPLPAYLPDTSIVLASVIKKVSLNGDLLPDVNFIMFITKDERTKNEQGNENKQYQRRYLKFPIKATYNGQNINERCIQAIVNQLGCTPEGSWAVTDMFFDEDVLCLKAIVFDPNNSTHFNDTDERAAAFELKKLIAAKAVANDFEDKLLSPLILYGPPGTGKTFTMQSDYIKKFKKHNCFVTTFHQSFSYEEFVEGLKPILVEDDDTSSDIKYKVENGVFKNACERAAQLAGYVNLDACIRDKGKSRKEKFNKAIEDKKTVLLCIDEINRGNVASIFGDLISLIEPSKRLGADYEMVVTLPYSKKSFGVPANLFIVGTMNTADRSIQLLDSALRRRFRFEEMLPNYDVITNGTAKTILKKINARIRSVLNKDNQIGHSYFIGVNSDNDIVKALVNKIIPLLEEYFYNDINKVRFILNEDDKTATAFYIKDVEAEKACQALSLDETEEDKSFYKLDESIANLSDADCGKYLEHLK